MSAAPGRLKQARTAARSAKVTLCDDELEALRRQLAERGLRFCDDDLRELLRGWWGLQPQIERVRARLAEPEGE